MRKRINLFSALIMFVFITELVTSNWPRIIGMLNPTDWDLYVKYITLKFNAIEYFKQWPYVLIFIYMLSVKELRSLNNIRNYLLLIVCFVSFIINISDYHKNDNQRSIEEDLIAFGIAYVLCFIISYITIKIWEQWEKSLGKSHQKIQD